jgi:Nucleotidyltransferase domain
MDILNHHRQTIQRLVDEYQNDPRFRALIIGGSVAKGCARPDSDVDFLIVATDDEFKDRKARGDLFINRTDLCDGDYPGGGYVDGKIISLSFLEALAEKGNEPSRAAFEGAFAAYSHIPGLDELIKNIPVYPEAEHDKRMRSFYCMAFMGRWLMNEATRHNNPYTITRAASQLALYAGRLILAHNRTLYPFHKWLMHALESVDKKPADLIKHIHALLKEPTPENADTVFEQVKAFVDLGITDLEAYTWFMTEVEWSWMSDSTPMEDW